MPLSDKRKAIFLDRDGVINRERGEYTYLLEDFKLNDGVVESLKAFGEQGFLLIVITNQGGIVKGIYTKEQVDYLHLHMERLLKSKGITLTEIYYCPHHSDLEKCLCRKPGSLLLEKAMARFNIDAAKSWFIGDNERDKQAGIKAGVQTILIPPNSSMLSILNQIS